MSASGRMLPRALPHRGLRGLACLAACTALVSTACSGPAEQAPAPVDTAAALNQANALLHRDPQIKALILREEQACMREKGFEWSGEESQEPENVDELLSRLTGGMTPERARTVGYGAPAGPGAAAEGKPLAPEEIRALNAYRGSVEEGDIRASVFPSGAMPANGCQATALGRAFGSAQDGMAYRSVPSHLAMLARNQIPGDAPELTELFKAWSSCMSRKGETRFQSPAQAEHAAQGTPDKLKDVAVKDAECRNEVPWTRVWKELFAQQFAQQLKAHEKEVLVYQEIEKRALEGAKLP